MTSPVIFIVLPLVAGFILFFLRKWEKWAKMAAPAVSLVLTILAFNLPVNQTISWRLWSGFPSFIIGDTFIFIGARFTIDQSNLPIIGFLYLSLTIWYILLTGFQTNYYFPPLCLIVLSIIASGFSLNPRAYAPLVLLTAAILCVPFFNPPGRRFHWGIGRFMISQISGLSLIMLANLMLISAAIQADVASEPVVPIVLLGIGFATAISVFPFHSWLMLVLPKGNNPESRLFLFLLPAVNLLLFFEIIIRTGLTSTGQIVDFILRAMGMLLVLFGGISAAFEKRSDRAFSFAVLHQIGLSLIAIDLALLSSNSVGNFSLFFVVLIQSGTGFMLWQLSERTINPKAEKTGVEVYRGGFRRYPLASTVLLMSIFSLSGLPALSGFPVQLEIWARLARVQPAAVPVGVAGSFFLSIFGIRMLGQLMSRGEEETDRSEEDKIQMAMLAAGFLILLLLGILPSIASPLALRMTDFLLKPIP